MASAGCAAEVPLTLGHLGRDEGTWVPDTLDNSPCFGLLAYYGFCLTLCPYPVSPALAVGQVPLASLFRPVLGVGLE